MPRQERAERTRHLLIEAAATSFDAMGFAMTGLSEVTQLAGVSKGALYFHFGSKEQLAEAVMAESREGLRGVIRTARHPGGPALQYLIDLCHGMAHRLDHDVVFRAGLRLTDEPGLGADRCPSPHPSWAKVIRRQLLKAATERDLQADVLLDEAATLLAATTAGIEVLARRDRTWLSQQVLVGLWQAVLPSMVAAERLGRLRTGRSGTDPRPHLPEQAAGPCAQPRGETGPPEGRSAERYQGA